MDNKISKILLKGYKSIKDSSLELGALNVLIGANGAGKSNFIGFFKLMQSILDCHLQLFVARQGGPDALLHFGRKRTSDLHAEIYFGYNGYKFTLEPTVDNRLMFAEEKMWWNLRGDIDIGSGYFESEAKQLQYRTKIFNYTMPAMKQWQIYHFHDTGESALVKQVHNIGDNQYLKTDAANLAAFLYMLKNNYQASYEQIVKTVKLAAPFFSDFALRPKTENKEKIELEWQEKDGDAPFKAHYLSDGTLRFICLCTVLLQPKELMPEVILIDEPELGLHPYAISLLSALIKTASFNSQIIISTQSTELLNNFGAEDIVVTDFQNGETKLNRLDTYQLRDWLRDYSLGELWNKNLLGGRPM